MKIMKEAVIFGCSVLFVLNVLNFSGCSVQSADETKKENASGGTDSGGTADGDGYGSEEKTAETVDCGITASDFGTDWEWNKRVEIAASKFADMVFGDYITFTTEVSETNADYWQLQLKSGEVYLGDGDS